MNGFAPHDGAAIEYWFWKLHVDGLAFLVDVILRRGERTAEVRVSQWLDGAGSVIHDTATTWTATPDEVVAGATTLRAGASRGAAGTVSWNLRWDDGGTVVTPLPGPLGRLEPFDTSILAWPRARFDGWIDVGGRRFDVRDVPGSFSHYWGRSLVDRWVWLSATHFEGQPARRLEAIVAIRTRLLGGPRYPIPLGFVWSTDGTRDDVTISTVNGLVRAREVPGGIAIDSVRPFGPRHRIVATWGTATPNDIGDGIVQTLLGDATVDGVRAVAGTVGLEARAWPSADAVAGMRVNR